MHGNFYASQQDERMGRLSKYEWSRFMGQRFNDQRGLAATLLHLPKEQDMTHAFKVGDKVRVINNPDNANYFQYQDVDIFKAAVVSAVNADGFVGLDQDEEAKHKPQRFELESEWAKHQRPFTGQFSAAKVDEGKKESAFLSARSKAWDKYAESRRLMNNLSSGAHRHEGFDEGYTQGFAAGKQAERTMIGLTVCEGRARCTDPENSKQAAQVVQAGKLADLVLVSLRDQGPGTAHEVAERIGHPLNAVSPRFVTLKRRGLIHVSGGQKAGRSTRSIYSYGGAPL